jgi:NAD(P)-dependent dehydrogenase (short-subunit alcohol dehydrogenase family)
MTRAFLRLVGLDRDATIVNVNTWGTLTTGPVGTSYFVSKLALGRLSESIPLAYPNISSMNYHPGMIRTDMADNHPEVLRFCKDTGTLFILPYPTLSALQYSANKLTSSILDSKLNSLLALLCT